MDEATLHFCDVSLPVPLHKRFTYSVPGHLAANLQIGCRVLVPFGNRKLTGVVLKVHNDQPVSGTVRDVLSLVDQRPVLDGALIHLAQWIADYYVAPLGEVLKGMLPLSGEMRRSKRYELTDTGRGIARQLVGKSQSDPALAVLSLLEKQPRSAKSLADHVGKEASDVLKGLSKRGWITAEEQTKARDPLRASAARLQVEFLARASDGIKLKKRERELLAYLELHPGWHNLAQLDEKLRQASEAARSLARNNLVQVESEGPKVLGNYAQLIPTLNSHQADAVDAVRDALNRKTFQAFLLQGVTGSGKTEVYLRSIEETLRLDKNALLLVPEIALTPAVAGVFFHRFGDAVAILHSAMGDGERADAWRRIQSGQARVVVGTRSGVFAPVQNLGLVVVDEEHDGSYKQGETPRYHGRDVALMRAREMGAVAIIGSATPSIESRFNADGGKYTLLRLPERVVGRALPEVEVLDMRVEFEETKQAAMFSRRLLEQLEARLARGEQAMLLINRRGWSSFMMCRACGERLQCTNCSVVLTLHKRDNRMLCHYCGYAEAVPTRCPACGSDYIQFLGTGAERVEDELHRHLPAARIGRLDRDSASAKGAFESILHSFREHELDILVGTQMIAKGHDIPNVTLVGIVLADIGLSMPDFRSAERSFQLLTQAAGRAGRGDLPGRVIVQTFNPGHYAVEFAAEQNYDGFYRKELDFRKWLRYPPFAAFANVLVRDEQQADALRMSEELAAVLNPVPGNVKLMGPAQAPVMRLKNEYRYQLLIKAASRPVLHQVIDRIRHHAEETRWKATALMIDIDPSSLL